MKSLNSYGRCNPADTDGTGDKWAGSTPGTDKVKFNPPPESPAVRPAICKSEKWSRSNSTSIPLLSLALLGLFSFSQS